MSAPTSSPLPTIDDLQVAGQRVLVRCDFNVPITRGQITDDLRIRAAIPTLELLLERGAKLVLCSHLGRPKGQVVEELRLAPVARVLAQLMGRPVEAIDVCVGHEAVSASLSPADVILLENLRFEPGETTNDPGFAAQLAELGDLYVNDAFGAAHRSHASVVGVAELLPAAAGLLLLNEVTKLSRIIESPDSPYVAILGGAKVSDKLAVIENLLGRVDAMCVGGAMAFTLLKAQGHDVGRSLVEEERVDETKDVLDRAAKSGVRIHLPVDVVAADSPDKGSFSEIVPLEKIGDRMGVDVGPETVANFAEEITAAKTVLWNGPMGIFEVPEFAEGTKGVAKAVVEATQKGAYTVVGGGDSAAALKQLELTDAVSHLSTGGGASLEFLEGKELPGIAVLSKKGKTQ